MITNGPTKIRIVRGKTGFRVVPGAAVVPYGRIAFRNLTDIDVEVVNLDPNVFKPSQLSIGPKSEGYVDVPDGAPLGLYEYDVIARDRTGTFYARGNSSPSIIVDP